MALAVGLGSSVGESLGVSVGVSLGESLGGSVSESGLREEVGDAAVVGGWMGWTEGTWPMGPMGSPCATPVPPRTALGSAESAIWWLTRSPRP